MNEFKLTRRAADPEKQALFDECLQAIKSYGAYEQTLGEVIGEEPHVAHHHKRSQTAAAFQRVQETLLKISQQSPGEWRTNLEE